MARYGMVIDVAKCVGCYNCMLACKDEHCGQEYPGYAAAQPMTGQFWMRLIEIERGSYPKVKLSYTPMPCMHCKDAACIKMAENNAVYRRGDGIVIIDPVKAQGQKQLVSACPYRVIYWNKEAQVPQKCTLCAHLLDQGWRTPRCVELCPTGALAFGDLDDPSSEPARLLASGQAEALRGGFDLDETVRYLHLPKKFVAGTVVFGDIDQCAKGAKVTLTGNGQTASVQTDGFGDFWFDGLQSNAKYTVDVEATGYQPRQLKAHTNVDVNLGDVVLTK